MNVKYIVIEDSAYYSSVRRYATEEDMLEGVQHLDLDYIAVFEVAREIQLVKQTTIAVARSE